MKKKKNLFFAKHAKSSAVLISLIVHGIIILVAISFVTFSVIIKKEKVFEAKEVKRPRLKLKKLQVPVRIEKRKKQTPKLGQRVVAKGAGPSSFDVQMPEIAAFDSGFGATSIPRGEFDVDISFSMPEVNFFGIKKKGEKIVFLVYAGFRTTEETDQGYSTPKSRMCYRTIQTRLNEMIAAMPEQMLFNVAVWGHYCHPFSTNLVSATQENKDLITDWSSTINPVELEGSLGELRLYNEEGFTDRIRALDWYKGERLEERYIPPAYPKWVYSYNPGPHILKYYPKNADEGWMDAREFISTNLALCFAMEQKADTIFIISTSYNGIKPGHAARVHKEMAKEIYGSKKNWPTINAIIMGTDGLGADYTVRERNDQQVLNAAFNGTSEILINYKDLLGYEERKAIEEMED